MTCHGLAFTFTRKLGLGIAKDDGHGFVLARLSVGALTCCCMQAIQPLQQPPGTQCTTMHTIPLLAG